MTVKDICRPKEELVSASENTSVRDLCQLMGERKVGCVVIEAEDRPAGIVTDRDVGMAFGAFSDVISRLTSVSYPASKAAC